MNPNTPNPEEFAKLVLWSLSGIQANITAIESDLSEISGRTTAEQRARMKKLLETQKRLYLEACGLAGLGTKEPPNAPPEASRN